MRKGVFLLIILCALHCVAKAQYNFAATGRMTFFNDPKDNTWSQMGKDGTDTVFFSIDKQLNFVKEVSRGHQRMYYVQGNKVEKTASGTVNYFYVKTDDGTPFTIKYGLGEFSFMGRRSKVPFVVVYMIFRQWEGAFTKDGVVIVP